jgi:hypothetical protein
MRSSKITLDFPRRSEWAFAGYDRETMTIPPSDFWLMAIAVILLLILMRLSALAKRIRPHFPTEKEAGYTPPAHLEAAGK